MWLILEFVILKIRNYWIFSFKKTLVGSRYLSILVIIANIEISSKVNMNISNFQAYLLAFLHWQHVISLIPSVMYEKWKIIAFLGRIILEECSFRKKYIKSFLRYSKLFAMKVSTFLCKTEKIIEHFLQKVKVILWTKKTSSVEFCNSSP